MARDEVDAVAHRVVQDADADLISRSTGAIGTAKYKELELGIHAKKIGEVQETCYPEKKTYV